MTFANEEAARQVTAHLLDLGRRRILVLCGDPAVSASAARRLDGHRQALAAAGLTFAPGMIRHVKVWDHEAGYRAVVDACRSGQEFDAVFAANDSIALGAMRGLHDEGVDVPGAVAVAGIDDVVEARFSRPRLTTVDPHRDTLAALAVATLAERIADPRRAGVVHEIAAHLRVRGSTSPGAELPA